jgi:hypothetical protein
MLEPGQGSVLSLIDALVATADRQAWARYCRLAAELEGGDAATDPVYAVGSVEWREQDEQRARSGRPPTPEDEAAGRQRLLRRGAAPPFAGAPSPFGAARAASFDEFVARHRGSPALLREIEAVEQELVGRFEAAGRSGSYRLAGFHDGARKEVDPDWFGGVRLDFARNTVLLADGSAIAGIEVTVAPSSGRIGARRERPAQALLREALVRLWERGAFTAGTGNERVLALALRELGLSASDPPYGFKSAETVRKLRKALKMSL